MKKIYLFFVFLLSTFLVNAQAPDAFNYQAIVKNDVGVILPSTSVTFRFEVYKSQLQTNGGTKVYSETQQVVTSTSGLVNLSIGQGTVEQGAFSSIDWSLGKFYIEISIDRGNGFASIGEQQLLNVPYAQFSSEAGNIVNKSSDGSLWGITINDLGQILTMPFPTGYTKMVWNDEFNGTGLPDATKWGYEYGYVRNAESQFYTKERIENAYQEDGLLHLVSLNDSPVIDGETRPITSASIITKGKASWLYGYVEVRAKVPYTAGTGVWPAIWMMSEKDFYGGWPASGEIDIMEYIASDYRNLHFAQHSRDFHGASGKSRVVPCPTAYTEFHTYGLQWAPESMTWFLDGVAVFRITNSTHLWSTWPFNKSFYLLLNLAMGGWGGTVNKEILKANPQDFQVDYVRVFQ